MYKAFYGLNERPFQLTPNPRFLFLNSQYREALATLRYGLTSALGITLLQGEAGTGKTTLLRAALHAERRPERRHVVLTNPTLTSADFYEILAARLGLPHAARSKGRFLLDFERDLLERHAAGGLTAIIIDEAQSLTHELFEEIRLLANLETPTAKLVTVVLVGQPELADRLNDPSLHQLKQRVVLRCSLTPLDLNWTASYVAARLKVAGAVPRDVFTKDAVVAIYKASRGIPRTIGVVCENALLAGFAAQKKPIDWSIVADVCQDLDLPSDGRPLAEEEAAPEHDIEAPDREVAAPGRLDRLEKAASTIHAAPDKRIPAPDQRIPAPEPVVSAPDQRIPAPEPRVSEPVRELAVPDLDIVLSDLDLEPPKRPTSDEVRPREATSPPWASPKRDEPRPAPAASPRWPSPVSEQPRPSPVTSPRWLAPASQETQPPPPVPPPWSSSRREEPKPEPEKEDPDAKTGENRTRVFRFL